MHGQSALRAGARMAMRALWQRGQRGSTRAPEANQALSALLFYSTGMRLLEGLRLRVEDVDFERTRSADPLEGVIRRHHLDEKIILDTTSVPCRSRSGTRTSRRQ